MPLAPVFHTFELPLKCTLRCSDVGGIPQSLLHAVPVSLQVYANCHLNLPEDLFFSPLPAVS
jgi:hypothetical protein